MINYKSTRGDTKVFTFSEVILNNIARDGGLFVPTKIPKFTKTQLQHLVGKSYQEIAVAILNSFQTDFSYASLKKIVKEAYGVNFRHKQIVPVHPLKENQFVLELWHGPTLAFKDLALQIMPLFFQKAVKRNNLLLIKQGKKPVQYLILVATSGDTGKAALEGYKNKKDINLLVFYPKDHVSQLQELQMVTQEGSNLGVFALEGNFDNVQNLVKEIFKDKIFQNMMKNRNIKLSSANSINWGRLLPQIIYHISSYLELINRNKIELGQQIDLVVPTGNFGNLLAAYYAKLMGLPIRKLICASNENNVLVDFLQTGVYSINNRSLIKTPSPSMDILIASNIERLLYLITNNTGKVTVWMKNLMENGRFEVDTETKRILQNEFYAGWVNNTACLQNITKIFYETNYIIDPHTSVAQKIGEQFQMKTEHKLPLLICSTAHWSKFIKNIYSSLVNEEHTFTNEFEILSQINSVISGVDIPENISGLRSKEIRFKEYYAVKKKLIEDVICNWLS